MNQTAMLRNLSFIAGLVCLLILPNLTYAQKNKRQIVNGISVPETNTATGPLISTDTPVGVKKLKFGVGLGPGINLRSTYSYTLLAPNYALSMDKFSPVAGVVSGIVIYNKTVFYQRDKDSQPYASTYPLSALLAINLASYAANATGNASGFNTRLDLGLGVGFRFDDNFQMGLFLDLASQRFLRDSYLQYLGNPVPDYKPSQNLTALDLTDDHYFISRTVPSFSLKLIYTITMNQPTTKEQNAAKAILPAAGATGTPPAGPTAAPAPTAPR